MQHQNLHKHAHTQAFLSVPPTSLYFIHGFEQQTTTNDLKINM